MISLNHIESNMSERSPENKLIMAIKHFVFGKTEAFEFIYNATAPKIMTLCKRYASNSDEAKDILQETYIKIYQNLKRFDVNSNFEAWAKRIAINTAIDHYRKNIKNTISLNEEIEQIEEEVFVSKDLLKYDVNIVLSAIQKLPDGYRLILNLYVLENKTHKEIAELLNINESTSRSQLTKARQTLKSMFNYGE